MPIVKELTEKQRKVLSFREKENLTFAEIAEIMGLKTPGIIACYYRAVKLRRIFNWKRKKA